MKTLSVVDLLERVGWTFVQALAGSIAAGGTAVSLNMFDWRAALVGAGTAAALSLLKVLGVAASTSRQLATVAPAHPDPIEPDGFEDEDPIGEDPTPPPAPVTRPAPPPPSTQLPPAPQVPLLSGQRTPTQQLSLDPGALSAYGASGQPPVRRP